MKIDYALQVVGGLIKAQIEENFKSSLDYAMKDPILFGDYMTAMDEGEPRLYQDVQVKYTSLYNWENKQMKFLQKISFTKFAKKLYLFNGKMARETMSWGMRRNKGGNYRRISMGGASLVNYIRTIVPISSHPIAIAQNQLV